MCSPGRACLPPRTLLGNPYGYLGFLGQPLSEALLLGAILLDFPLQPLQVAFQFPDALQESRDSRGSHQRSCALPRRRTLSDKQHIFPTHPVPFPPACSPNLYLLKPLGRLSSGLSTSFLTAFSRIVMRRYDFYRSLRFSGSLRTLGAFYYRSWIQTSSLKTPS